MAPLVVKPHTSSTLHVDSRTSLGGSLRQVSVLQVYNNTTSENWCVSACQDSQNGAEHAATVATALNSSADPGGHRNSNSGRILG